MVAKHIFFPILGAAVAAALSFPAAAQQAPDKDTDPCSAEGACRFIEEYVLEGPDGQEYRFPVGTELPWVVDHNILLTPGEAVAVSLEQADGYWVPVLARTGDAARTEDLQPGEILFDFGAHDMGSVTLVVQSNFAEPLEYAALLVDINSGPSRTSVCTLMPGVAVYEIWQQPIYQLALWNFRETDGYACEIIEPDANVEETE